MFIVSDGSAARGPTTSTVYVQWRGGGAENIGPLFT